MIYIRGAISPNLGDSANIELVRAITDETPKLVNNTYKIPDNETNYLVMGSVLMWADKNSIVWGAGKISDTDTTFPKEHPKQILAVRGKLTRHALLDKGFDCPAVYGDPFLLMSKFYPMTHVKKEYKLGIIPHTIELNLIPQLKKQFPNANIIELNKHVISCIEEVNKCEMIVSSALHGIICADTYGIPVIWIKMSEKVLGKGFKYLDYFSSINRVDKKPLIYTESITIDDIERKFKNYNKPEIDLEPLWNCCPFNKKG